MYLTKTIACDVNNIMVPVTFPSVFWVARVVF